MFYLRFYFVIFFIAAPAAHRWWGSGERARRPGHTAGAPQDNRPTHVELPAELYAIEARLQHSRINVPLYKRTIAFCVSVDVVLRCPKTTGPVGLKGGQRGSFFTGPSGQWLQMLNVDGCYVI